MTNALKLQGIFTQKIDRNVLDRLDEDELTTLLDELSKREKILKNFYVTLNQLDKEMTSIKGQLNSYIKKYLNSFQKLIDESHKIIGISKAEPLILNLLGEKEDEIKNLIKEIEEILNEDKLSQLQLKLRELHRLEKEMENILSEKLERKYFNVYKWVSRYFSGRETPLRLHELVGAISKDMNLDASEVLDILLKLDEIGIIKISISKM